jgi:diadenosine tetraphosphate (Ap4A) HIT family hydrolase
MAANPNSAGWRLDPQIERDTVPVGDLPLCQLRLMNDANYPWLLLVPRRPGVNEIGDLGGAERARLMAEITETSQALKAITACDKINVASLGNVVAQLHLHVIARFRSDAAWPKPVWGAAPPRAYPRDMAARLTGALRQRLALGESSAT